MLGAFWSTVGGKLGDRWLASSLPAVVFWLGGATAYLMGHGGLRAVSSLATWIFQQPPTTPIVLLIAALLLIAASALFVARLVEPALHLIEGYWPLWALRTYRWIRARRKHSTHADDRWQYLNHRIQANGPALRPEEYTEFLRLDRARRRQPTKEYRRMPTRVGNILRTAESLPRDKYGLDVVAVWPRLWLLLPPDTRAELVSARRAMTTTVAAGVWGVLFCGFGVLTFWAVVVGVAVATLSLVMWLPGLAQTYGDLLEAAFDVHRSLLYNALRWPLPTCPADESKTGEQLTTYLWRGSDAPSPTFVDQHEPAPTTTTLSQAVRRLLKTVHR